MTDVDDTKLPRYLERRRGCAVSAIVGGVLAALVFVVLLVEGVRPGPVVWTVFVVVEVTAVVAVVVVRRRTTDDDLKRIADARWRRYEPPDGPVTPRSVRVPLRAGRVRARRLGVVADQLWLTADDRALTIPTWVIDRPPRGVRAGPSVTLRWSDVARWRVVHDSDGPDQHEITTTAPWFAGVPGRHWPPLRLNRRHLADEAALIAHVRGVGRITVEFDRALDDPPPG